MRCRDARDAVQIYQQVYLLLLHFLTLSLSTVTTMLNADDPRNLFAFLKMMIIDLNRVWIEYVYVWKWCSNNMIISTSSSKAVIQLRDEKHRAQNIIPKMFFLINQRQQKFAAVKFSDCLKIFEREVEKKRENSFKKKVHTKYNE